MGHKVHPVGFRVGVIHGWDAKWYADKHYVTYLQEDLKIRRTVRSMYPEAGVSQVEIDRQANNVTLTIHTARPGILIGRGGQRVDEMRNALEKLIGKKIQLNIREVQQPELDAFLVARSVADQMERRVAYRRAMKQALLRTIQAGAKGMRIRCAGRLDGAEIARKVIMHEGRVPLHTIRADVDYGLTEAHTVMGRIGVKVWIYKGDILPEKEEPEVSEAAPRAVTIPAPEAAPVAETIQAIAHEATAAVPETPVSEAKPIAQPAPAEEKPRVRRVSRSKATTTEIMVTDETAPAAEAKPRTTARRTPRPKKATVDTKAEGTTTDAQPKATAKRAPRATMKIREAKKEDTAEKPSTSAESADRQGEANATT